jgi:hypothetical protein
MKYNFLSMILLVLFPVLLSAQYTEIINSKRPGFSESPYGIGTGVYQVETGFFYLRNKDPLVPYHTSYGGTAFLRYSRFSEKLEFNAQITYQWDQVNVGNKFVMHADPLYELDNVLPFGYRDRNGLSDVLIGAKYMLRQQEYTDKSKEIRSWKRRMAFDKKRLIPSVGVYLGVHTNFVGTDFKEEGMTYKAAILLQHDISSRMVVLSNLIADHISSDIPLYSYIMTMTYAVSDEWSYFIENQGIFKDISGPFFQFGTGLAYLWSADLQFDASIRTNFFDDFQYTYLAAGVAWRLDRHQDALIVKKTPKPPKIKRPKNRDGFFKRLFRKKRN